MDSSGRLPLVLYYDRTFLFESPKESDIAIFCENDASAILPAEEKKDPRGPCAFDLGSFLPATVTCTQTQTISSELNVTVTPLAPFILQTGPNSASMIGSRTHRIFVSKGKKRLAKNHLEKIIDKRRADDGGMCNVCRVVPYQFFHFGAFVCNRCRAFFRRCVRRVRSGQHLTPCLTTKTRVSRLADHTPICDISVFRGACQICRYVKCLNVGMNTDSVMTDKARLSKYSKKGSKAASTRERLTPTPCESYVNMVTSNEDCLNNSPEVVEEACQFGNAGFAIKLSPVHDPFPVPEVKLYENFQEAADCSNMAAPGGQFEICAPTTLMLSNVAADSPNNVIFSAVSERFNKPPEAAPLSLDDFLYYYKPLRDPPWFDDPPDEPEPFDYVPTHRLFDPVQVVPSNSPEELSLADPGQFNFTDIDDVLDSKSPVDNFQYCCSF